MQKHPETGHALATWGIEVSDDFTIAVLQPTALRIDTKTTNDFYELPPIGLTLPVLKRLHAEFGGLIEYMEKGVKNPQRTN